MCRSAPPRISNIERLEDPDFQEPLLPFEIHTGFANWTLGEEENWGIESDPEWSPVPVGGALDDQDFMPRFDESEEEDRQLRVYRGLEHPQSDEDWRQILERFDTAMFDVTGVLPGFREWESAYANLSDEEDSEIHGDTSDEEDFWCNREPDASSLFD